MSTSKKGCCATCKPEPHLQKWEICANIHCACHRSHTPPHNTEEWELQLEEKINPAWMIDGTHGFGWNLNDLKEFIRALLHSHEEAWKQTGRRLANYTFHDSQCIRLQFNEGRPTEDGGYKQRFADKWYEARPIDKTPKCDCGLDDLLTELDITNEQK